MPTKLLKELPIPQEAQKMIQEVPELAPFIEPEPQGIGVGTGLGIGRSLIIVSMSLTLY